MKKIVFGICFFICMVNLTNGQSLPEIKLSQKQIKKIEGASSAKLRLKLYRKYYHKDSLQVAKKLERQLQAKHDSLMAAIQLNESQVKTKADSVSKFAAEKLNSEIRKLQPSVSGIDTISLPQTNIELGDKISPLKDQATIPKTNLLDQPGKLNNSISKQAGDATKKLTQQLPMEKADYSDDLKNYQAQVESYTKNDSLLKQEIKSRAVSEAGSIVNENKEIQTLKEFKKQSSEFDPAQNEYKKQFDQLQDSTYLKEQARKKAEEMAMNYLAENPAIIKAAKSKMDVLMKKYSIIPNSNDLSTAVKRTSLEGKSFRERLYLAGNFQVMSFKPISFDFSPMIGYRFSTRLIAGIGANVRKTFGDTLAGVSADMFGYKAFVSYDVFRNFFAYSEFANNSTGTKRTEVGVERVWNCAYFLGVGRKFTLHPKAEMTVVILYNFTHKPEDNDYHNPWVVRFGFQLSELALLKRKPELSH